MKKRMKKILATALLTSMILEASMVNGITVYAANPTGVPYTTEGAYDVTVGHVIINQVYGGGNNKGGGSHGFIELYNPTNEEVDLSEWSVQYQGAACDDKNTPGWHKLDLTGTIPAHSSYLIRTKQYKADTTPANYDVPAGDQEWSDLTINGKGVCLVLMSNQTLLSDNNVFDNTTKKPIVSGYVDMVGVNGNDSKEDQVAACKEGYTTDTQSTKKGVRRIAFQDTDCNGVGNDDGDFVIIEYNATDAKYIEWAHPRTVSDGAWEASEMPEFTETTTLSNTSINTLTNTFGNQANSTRQFKWQMPVTITDGYVLVSEKADLSDARKVTAECAKNHKENANVFHAVATGLKAETTYYYKVVSDQAESAVYSFTTGTVTGEFTFVHASDSQSKAESGYDVLKDAMGKIYETYAPAFILESGDLVDTNYFEDEWRWYIGKSQDVFASTAFMPVVGNHEQNAAYDAWAFREHFSVPNSCTDANVTPGTVYSFDYGNAHFVVLNTECKGEGLKAQAEWAKKDMASTNQKFIIVSMHRGLYGGGGIATDVKEAFLPVFDEYQVDLVLFGHDHSYIRSKALKNDAEDVNGTIYLEGGGCASKQDSAADTLPNYAEISGTPGKPVYNIVSVNDQNITVKTVTVDDTLAIESLENSSTLKKISEDKKVDFTISAKDRKKENKEPVEDPVKDPVKNPVVTPDPNKTEEPSKTDNTANDNKVNVTKNTVHCVNSMKYKVTNDAVDGKGTVELVGTTKSKAKLKTLSVGKTVKIDGITYKVTSIGSAAFSGYKALKSVKLGANVSKLSKNAFKDCTKLSKVILQSKKPLKVEKNAIRNIKKNAVIDVPNKKVSTYKKLFKANTGFKKFMKLK